MIRFAGDRLLASDSNRQNWSTLQDVKLNLNYPPSGIGPVITYLEVIVDQVILELGLAKSATGANEQNTRAVQTLPRPIEIKSSIEEIVKLNKFQSSNLGNAYVVSGGIGQRRIAVVVEAKQTLYFHYQAAVYGY